MMKFFLFNTDIEDREAFCFLPELPDNYETMKDENVIIYKYREVVTGLKWDNVDWFYNSAGFEIPKFKFIKYVNGELINGE